MALKFGSLFGDTLSKEFSFVAKKIARQTQDLFDPKMVGRIKEAKEKLKALSTEFKTSITEIKKLKQTYQKQSQSIEEQADALQTLEKGTDEYKAALERLTNAKKKLRGISNELTTKTEKQSKTEKKLQKAKENADKVSDSTVKKQTKVLDYFKDKSTTTFAEFKESFGSFASGMNNLKLSFDAGKISEEQYTQKRDELTAGFGTKGLSALTNDFSGSLEGMKNAATNIIGEGLGNTLVRVLPGKLAALAGPLGMIISELLIKGITAAFEQIMQLNEALIGLQRSTGGVATAANLGYDAFGNAKNGIQSLTTATLQANISIEQFAEAIQSFVGRGTEAIGNIAGIPKTLEQSGAELQRFGIEAGRIAKLYGADVGPAVRNLFKNFGTGIGDSTKMMKGGVDTARSMGLNVEAFVENMQEATELAGELYFKTNEELVRMAGLASKLGTSVNTIAKGIAQMNGLTGLFEQQQKMAALGLHNVGKQLSKIYALRATGQSGKAAQVELGAFGKDIDMFRDAAGAVSQQGIATLQAAGATQEQIQVIQRMSRVASEAGIAIDKAFDPKSLSGMKQIQLALAEQGNITLTEQFGQITGLLKQTFIDPIAAIIGPVVKALADIAWGLTKFVSLVSGIAIKVIMFASGLGFLVSIIKGIGEAFVAFGAAVETIYNEIASFLEPLISALKPVFDWIGEVGERFGNIIGAILIPVILAGLIPPLFAAAAALWSFVAPVLAIALPFLAVAAVIWLLWEAIEYIAENWTAITDWISDAVETYIIGPFKWIGSLFDTISEKLGWFTYVLFPVVGVFKLLWWAIEGIIDVFKDLWEALTSLAHHWPLSAIFGTEEDIAKTTVEQVAAGHQGLVENNLPAGATATSPVGSIVPEAPKVNFTPSVDASKTMETINKETQKQAAETAAQTAPTTTAPNIIINNGSTWPGIKTSVTHG